MCYDDHDYCLDCNRHSVTCWHWSASSPLPPEGDEDWEYLCRTPDSHEGASP